MNRSINKGGFYSKLVLLFITVIVILLIYYTIRYKKEIIYVYTIGIPQIIRTAYFEPPHDVPFYIGHTKGSERSASGTPLIIYQTWHTRMVPKNMKDNIQKLLDMNPEFDYYLYSDDDCLKFIEDNFKPEVANAFNALIPGAYKSDLWRYCILYINGGLYLDIKFYSLMPLIDIVERNPVIFVKDLPRTCPKHIGLYNAFMASPPKNDIFMYCIDDIVNSCKFKLYKANPLDITGPCLLGEIITKYKSYYYANSFEFRYLIGKGADGIFYKDVKIIECYTMYRIEQFFNSKKAHYSNLYSEGSVYNSVASIE